MKVFSGLVKDPSNCHPDSSNIFDVEAEDIEDAANKIARVYVFKYELSRGAEVTDAKIYIEDKVFEFDYFATWKCYVSEKGK